MSDIRKRAGKNGTTYQVRYPDKSKKSGHAYATFKTMKEARAFRDEQSGNWQRQNLDHSVRSIANAVYRWLEICEKEGTDGNDPVTAYTRKNYQYFASFMTGYPWSKELQELTPPDIVLFRSWLLKNCPSRYVARKTLSYFHTVLKEMMLRGHIASNVATGISVNISSRYSQPVTPPSLKEFRSLLAAADRLANSKNKQIAKAWERYRPMLYLAGDTGMRPGEYLALPRFNLTATEVKVDRAIERNGHRISVTKTPSGWRWIDISPDIAEMVMRYADRHAPENPHDLVFPTKTGNWQSIINWRKLGFSAACFEAGLVETVEVNGRIVERPKFSPYDLRHFYASMLIQSRINLKRIQTLMGHTNITTTLNIYGHLIERAEGQDEDKRGLIARINAESCGKFVADAR